MILCSVKERRSVLQKCRRVIYLVGWDSPNEKPEPEIRDEDSSGERDVVIPELEEGEGSF
jgi:hypothetical protein